MPHSHCSAPSHCMVFYTGIRRGWQGSHGWDRSPQGWSPPWAFTVLGAEAILASSRYYPSLTNCRDSQLDDPGLSFQKCWRSRRKHNWGTPSRPLPWAAGAEEERRIRTEALTTISWTAAECQVCTKCCSYSVSSPGWKGEVAIPLNRWY